MAENHRNITERKKAEEAMREGASQYQDIVESVSERKRFEEMLRVLTRAMDQSPVSVVISDTDGKMEYVNARFCEITGFTAQEILGKNPEDIRYGTTPQGEYQQMLGTIVSGNEWRGELCNRKKNGDTYWESEVISPIKNENGVVTHILYLGVKEDIAERKRMEKEREIIELQLRQSQKLESVGQLASGIAHEINTPIQYVGDNLRFIQDSFANLKKLVFGYEKMFAGIPAGALEPGLLAVIEKARKETDFSYLAAEIPTAIQQSLDGVQRVADIVRAMKEFSHPGGKEKIETDINHAIQTTITVTRNEWKYVADVVTELAPDLPKIPCFPDEFNQVILNLLINAAQAIGDVVNKSGGKGMIRVVTRLDGAWVEIRIADTGAGIPEEIRHRIFDLFFTTKEVGKGTGQGLALARSVIVKKHGGELTFESSVGQGTTFVIRLPVSSKMPVQLSAIQ